MNYENLFLKHIDQTALGIVGSKDFQIMIMAFFQPILDLMLLHKFYRFINFISVSKLDKKITWFSVLIPIYMDIIKNVQRNSSESNL